MMMILDLHAQNNSRFSAHACQRITEFLAELDSFLLCFDLFCVLFQLASHHWKYLISSFRIERQVLDGWIQVSSSALALFLFFFFFKTLIDS